jgi:hypothetical protein
VSSGDASTRGPSSRTRRRRAWIAALVVLAILILLLILRGCDHREACMTNLLEIGRTLDALSDDARRDALTHRGVAMLLSLRKRHLIDERLLRCPDDPDLRPLDDAARRAYDEVDLADPPDDLCSYAVRDFVLYPLPSEGSQRKEAIACCRCGRDGRTPHHRGGTIVLFSERDVQYFYPQQLEHYAGHPFVVGPDSKWPLLQPLIQRPPK